MVPLIASIVFLGWGAWCIVAAFLKKKIQVQLFHGEEFLPKKILGKYFDFAMNLVYGTLSIIFGSIGLLHYFGKI